MTSSHKLLCLKYNIYTLGQQGKFYCKYMYMHYAVYNSISEVWVKEYKIIFTHKFVTTTITTQNSVRVEQAAK